MGFLGHQCSNECSSCARHNVCLLDAQTQSRTSSSTALCATKYRGTARACASRHRNSSCAGMLSSSPSEFLCEVKPAPTNGVYLAGALLRCLAYSCLRDILLWCRSSTFVEKSCMLYIGGAVGEMQGDSRNGRTFRLDLESAVVCPTITPWQ